MEDSVALFALHDGVQFEGENDLILLADLANEAFASTKNTLQNVTQRKLDGRMKQSQQATGLNVFQITNGVHVNVFIKVGSRPQHFGKSGFGFTFVIGAGRQVGIHVSQLSS